MDFIQFIGSILCIAIGVAVVFVAVRFFARFLITVLGVGAFLLLMYMEDKHCFSGTGDMLGSAFGLGLLVGFLSIPLFPFTIAHWQKQKPRDK